MFTVRSDSTYGSRSRPAKGAATSGAHGRAQDSRYPMRVSLHRGPLSCVAQPCLTRPLSAGSGASRPADAVDDTTHAAFLNAIQRYAVGERRVPVAGLANAQRAIGVDGRGIATVDGQSYITIDGRDYRIEQSGGRSHIVCEDNPCKPRFSIRFHESTARWTLDDMRGAHGVSGLRGGSDGACREALESFRQWAQRIGLDRSKRLPIERAVMDRKVELDLSGIEAAEVPHFVSLCPWIDTLSVRPGPGTFRVSVNTIQRIDTLRVMDGEASKIKAGWKYECVPLAKGAASVGPSPFTLEIHGGKQLEQIEMYAIEIESLKVVGAGTVRKISVVDCDLQGIELRGLDNLESLALAHNALTNQTFVMDCAPKLKHIDLSYNAFERWPQALTQCGRMDVVNIAGNKLVSVDHLAESNAKRIDAHRNAIKRFPARLGSQLEHLNLAYNQIEEIGSALDSPCVLRQLFLGHNKLCALPAWLWTQTTLVHLGLENNDLDASALGKSISALGALRTLNLQSNRLSCVPPVLGELASLRDLDLSHNMVQNLPDALSALSLRRLELGHNPLNHIPRILLSGPFSPDLERLGLARTGLSEIPAELANHRSLERLDLSGNRSLSTLPAAITKLERLTELNLNQCGFRELPAEFASLNRTALPEDANSAIPESPAVPGPCAVPASADVPVASDVPASPDVIDLSERPQSDWRSCPLRVRLSFNPLSESARRTIASVVQRGVQDGRVWYPDA